MVSAEKFRSSQKRLELSVSLSDTGRGLGESPEVDLDRARNLHPHETTPTQRRPPTTPRKRYDGHTPHPAPGPGPHRDRAPVHVHVHGHDPGLDASQEDARKLCARLRIRHHVRWTRVVHLSRKELFVFDMNVMSPEAFVDSLFFAAPF